jgi:hypothetical protein
VAVVDVMEDTITTTEVATEAVDEDVSNDD